MAEREGSTYKTIQQNGQSGNGSVALLKDTLAGDAIADVIKLGKLPGACTIFAADLVNAALGASTTISLGYRYLNPDDGSDDLTAFHNAQATVAAGRNAFAGAPVQIAPGKGVEIVATVGGGVATGPLDAIMQYDFHGQ